MLTLLFLHPDSCWCYMLSQIEDSIVNNELVFESETWDEISAGAKDFISR